MLLCSFQTNSSFLYLQNNVKYLQTHCVSWWRSRNSTTVYLRPASNRDWSFCFICKEMTPESLTSPSQNTRQDEGSSYSILAGHLRRFNDLGLLLKSFLFSRLDEGSGVEAALNTNNARYHKTCRLRYNKSKFDRAEKRHLKIGDDKIEEATDGKRTRNLSRPSSTEPKQQEVKCFFCREAPGSASVHKAATFQPDSRAR